MIRQKVARIAEEKQFFRTNDQSSKLMPTFRHFVAVGVGAAIALSFMEPGASKDLPSLTQPHHDQAETQESESGNEPIQGHLTESVQTPQTAESSVEGRKAPTSATDDSEAVGSSLVSEQPEVSLPVEENAPAKPVVSSKSAATPGATDVDRSKTSNPASEPVEVSTSKPIASPTTGTQKLAEQVVSNPVSTPGTAIREARGLQEAPKKATPAPDPLQNPSKPVQDEIGKPVSPLDGTKVVQYPAPVTPQSPQVAPNTPVPNFLNPSPNPLLFPTQSQEVQVQSTQPITLEQAIELARRNNRQLQAAQLTLERTQFALQEALAAEFPTAGVQANFNRTEGGNTSQDQINQLLGRNNQNQNSVTTSFTTALQLTYDLFTAGRRPAQIRAAERQVRFQQLEVERLAQQLRLDVSNAYYALQQADATVDINRAAVTDAAQSLRDAQLLEQAGLGTRFDVLQAQVQLANANQDLTRALSQQRISRRQIVQLLSLAQSAEVSAADPIEVAGEWNLSLEQSIVLAFKNRAELEQQLVQREISEQQRRIALAAIRPQVGLNASYSVRGILNDNAGPTDGLSLGAQLQWNFFDGGAARARANQQRTNIAIAETNFATQRNQVRFDVEQSFFDLTSNAQNIQTATLALSQAQESLRLARLRFQAGVGTQLEVINQQTALTRARGNRLTAILDYNRALASLQRAVSNLPDSNLFDLPGIP